MTQRTKGMIHSIHNVMQPETNGAFFRQLCHSMRSSEIESFHFIPADLVDFPWVASGACVAQPTEWDRGHLYWPALPCRVLRRGVFTGSQQVLRSKDVCHQRTRSSTTPTISIRSQVMRSGCSVDMVGDAILEAQRIITRTPEWANLIKWDKYPWSSNGVIRPRKRN